MANPLVFFQIGTRDVEASRRFFSEVFDWDLDGDGGGIDPGGPGDFDVKGAFFQLPEGDAPPHVTLYFRVNDLDATVARAERSGARMVLPRSRTAGGVDVALIRAPEGQVIGIVQA